MDQRQGNRSVSSENKSKTDDTDNCGMHCRISGRGAIGPFIKYKDVSSQTAEEFRADSFRSSEAGTDRAMLLKQVKAPWNTAYG